MKNLSLSRDLLLASLASVKPLHSDDEIMEWLEDRKQRVHVTINKAPLNKLARWNFTDDILEHESKKFFSIKGLKCQIAGKLFNHKWDQPVISQPEIGILGIIVRVFDGVPHFLIQAKIEPGNLNFVQLSPTLQATKSNYTAVHQGRRPNFVDYFIERKGVVIYDQLQSEQGSRFFQKRNRNIILQVEEDVPTHEDFRWMTLRQIFNLMKKDNLINMDTRTVLAGLALAKDVDLNSVRQIMYWLTGLKSDHEWQNSLCSLSELEEWKVSNGSINHKSGQYFSVIGALVEIENREVATWSQPMIAPTQKGLIALLARKKDSGWEFLFQAKPECGLIDGMELAPTVQSLIYDDKRVASIPFMNYVLNSSSKKHLADVLQSEEGGRFYHEENRNMIVVLDKDEELKIPENFIWVSHSEIMFLINFNNVVNIQARCLITLVNSVINHE